MSGGPGMPRRYLKTCSALNMDMRTMEIESVCYQFRIVGHVRQLSEAEGVCNRYENLIEQLAMNARGAYQRYESADGLGKWLWRNYTPALLMALARAYRSFKANRTVR
jgi:hypothetical protein